MPQGKGTYGSKVGRPPKKKYNKGGNVDPFSTRNPKGVPAEQLSEMMENQNMASEGLPTSNAQERSQVSPDVTSYKEGGKVDYRKSSLESDPMKLRDRRLAKTPPQKGGGMAQSKKQKEEQKLSREKARKRIAKEKMEYGRPKKKKKWSGQA